MKSDDRSNILVAPEHLRHWLGACDSRSGRRRRRPARLIAMFIAIVSLARMGLGDLVPATQSAPASLNLIAMGDWGEGSAAQKQVAAALETYVVDQKIPFEAALLAGDNFYVPLTGVDDPQWSSLFEKMYDPARLNFPFYAVLGNHDYDGGKDRIELEYAKANPQSRWKMPARHFRIELPAEKPMATVLMLDSNRQVLSGTDWDMQTRWLDAELAKPRTSRWLICCAHHPLFSNGFAADNGILQHDWGLLFKKYDVDFYVCGHEHNLQDLRIPGWKTSFVLCGGGGAHAHPMLRDNRGPFSRSVFGFVHLSLSADTAVVSYIGIDGKPVHEFEQDHSGKTKVLLTTRSDSPSSQPLRAILGILDKGAKPATQPATAPASQP